MLKVRIPEVGSRVYFYGVGYGTVLRIRRDESGNALYSVYIDTFKHPPIIEPVNRVLIARGFELIPCH